MDAGVLHGAVPTLTRRALVRAGGIAALLVPPTVWSSLLLFGVLHDGFRLIANPVSDLGARGSPHATAFNLAHFFGTGLLILLVAAGMAALGHKLTAAAAVLLAVCGAAFIASGIFPADDAGSSAMAVHQGIGTVLLWTMPLVPLAAGASAARSGARRYAGFSWGTAAVLAAIGVLVLTLPEPLQARTGTYQRAWLFVSSVWFAVTGVEMLRRRAFAAQARGKGP